MNEQKMVKFQGEIVKTLRPTVLIGAAAISGVFTPEIIRDMARSDLKSNVNVKMLMLIVWFDVNLSMATLMLVLNC